MPCWSRFGSLVTPIPSAQPNPQRNALKPMTNLRNGHRDPFETRHPTHCSPCRAWVYVAPGSIGEDDGGGGLVEVRGHARTTKQSKSALFLRFFLTIFVSQKRGEWDNKGCHRVMGRSVGIKTSRLSGMPAPPTRDNPSIPSAHHSTSSH